MSGTNPVLLLTKLHIPPPRPQVIGRARLFELISRRPGTRLVLVSAPAGFGKTTFLADWCHAAVHQGRPPVAWYLLDEGDNDPVRFVAYLVTTLSQALDGRVKLGPAKEVIQATHEADVEQALTLLVNTIVSAACDCVLVLDDYHTISSPAVHMAVAFLLDNLPDQLRLVIGTRSDPPLQLSRLRARDQLVEVRATDLRFTLAETIDFFYKTANISLSKQEARAIDDYAEGWAAALQLLAIALKQRLSRQGQVSVAEFITRFSDSQRNIFDYLADEVFERQLPDVRCFLLDTALLNRLSGSLCDVVTGRSDSVVILDQLERANLFLIPLDEERHWYRYHHLFGQFLRQRLAREQPDKVVELRQRAGKWYEQNELFGEAKRLASSASDSERRGLTTSASYPLSPLAPLSIRELEVLRLLANGASNQEVAEALVISLSTAKVHVHHILDKLDARNRTEAVARARELGLL